jgi:hypothetical protein
MPLPDPITMHPVGHVAGGRRKATKDGRGRNRCALVLDPDRFRPDALVAHDG